MKDSTDITDSEEDISSGADQQKPIGIIIPGFGHPQFLAEAILSACSQDITAKVPVVVVDDGCPFPESRQTVLGLMQQFPNQLHYVRQENKRLPGARNTGIKFLMSLYPDMEAIYFLDADNRLAPFSLQSFRKALFSGDKIGWAYPDIGFFGQTLSLQGHEIRETAPHYSRLKHLVANISEAGSLVKTELFKQGVMFDETLRSGFEDWDFWLSALGKGYRGIRAEQSGFFYRRRPESMLAEARREADGLVAKLRAKHAKLYARDAVAQLEHDEAPAFAVFIADADEVFLFSDPLAPVKYIDHQAFKALLSAWRKNRRELFFPPHILILNKATWLGLSEWRQFLRWLFWRLRSDAEQLEYYALFNAQKPYLAKGVRGVLRETSMLHVSARCFLKLTQSDITTERKIVGHPVRSEIRLPAQVNLTGHDYELGREFPLVHERILRTCLLELIKEQRTPINIMGHMDRRYAGPDAAIVRGKIMPLVYDKEEFEPFIVAEATENRIAVALNADSLIANSAIAQILDGLLTKLKGHYSDIQGFFDSFVSPDFRRIQMALPSIHHMNDILINRRSEHAYEYQLYLGRRVKEIFIDQIAYEQAMPALGVKYVILIGNAAFLDTLGEVRAHGGKGVLWLDRKFFGSDEEFSAMLDKTLAFEHALDRIWCDDAETQTRLSAMGIPPSKLISSEKGLLRICG